MSQEITFGKLGFVIQDGRVLLNRMGNLIDGESNFVEVQITGENKPTHMGAKMASSSEGSRLCYVSHRQTDNRLEIVQQSELIRTITVFEGYENCNAVLIHTEVENISEKELVLEEVSAFLVWGLGKCGLDSAANLYYTRFYQSHHAECQPVRDSFAHLGLFRGNVEGQKRIAGMNVGSWSTKEELPQALIEDTENGEVLFFQVESNASWYYEIADRAEKYYLYLGGANLPFGGWKKRLQPGQSYRTRNVALAFGASVDQVVGEMTKYRRIIAGKSMADQSLPVIFNEYMHLSWDSPTEENTRRVAPTVANTGAEYYVIDCGWHNEEDGDKVYPFVGQWKESRKRFPHGVRATTDYIRSLGMKAGLWIEPEVVGIQCQEMLNYYDDDCFLQRDGRRLAVMDRYFLDYRNQKVRAYMSETIRRMVEEYGAEYVKIDYNQDCGVGTDWQADSAGEGLELAALAFLDWVCEMKERFPDVIFEGCASGGMRMDYKTLSVFSLASTSDQVDYLKYPYIAGNILSAVIPEQAAVWSYPVGAGVVGQPLTVDAEWVKKHISANRITMNMINSFLGRMHLASHLELLDEEQMTLVREGVSYYQKLVEPKKRALPCFPNGFTCFGADNVVAGFQTDHIIYLAVWHFKGRTDVEVHIEQGRMQARIAYPSTTSARLEWREGRLTVVFSESPSAVFLEIGDSVGS